MPEIDEDRYVKPEDVEVERWGVFIGWALSPGNGDFFHYHYNIYARPEDVVELYPNIVDVANPFLQLIAPGFRADLIKRVNALTWEEGKKTLFTAEVGDVVLFISNHIPVIEGTTFTMSGDHSKCTNDHCVEADKPE